MSKDKLLTGEYYDVPVIEGKAKILNKGGFGDIQVLLVTEDGIEMDWEADVYLDGATKITKEQFEAAYDETLQRLEAAK